MSLLHHHLRFAMGMRGAMRRRSAMYLVLGVLIPLLMLSAGREQFLTRPWTEKGEALSFDVSMPIDCSIADGNVLRRVARARAVQMARGPELIVTASQQGRGAAVALNALLNLHALGYNHGLLVDNGFAMGEFGEGLCAWMSRAAARLRSPGTSVAVRGTPCLVDSWWRDVVLGKVSERRMNATRTPVLHRAAAYFTRFVFIARFVRLGYNVMSLDADAAILDDIYPHLHSRALGGRFTLMFASENRDRANGLQNGFLYAVGASRDGAATWVLSETIDRMLRTLDLCENGGTPCPVGSWLRGAWLWQWSEGMDQAVHIDVTHTAIARDGRLYWHQAGQVVHRGWPFRQIGPDGSDETALLRRFQTMRYSHGEMRVSTRRGNAPLASAGSRGASLAVTAGKRDPSFHGCWIDASLRLTANESSNAGSD